MQYDHLTHVKTLILQSCTRHCQRQCLTKRSKNANLAMLSLTKRSKTQILQCYVDHWY